MESLREKLQQVQNQLHRDPLNAALIGQEKIVLADLKKWSDFEEKIGHQKDRVDWIKLGDSNIKFFHAYAKERTSQKAIKLLLRQDGTRNRSSSRSCSFTRGLWDLLPPLYQWWTDLLF